MSVILTKTVQGNWIGNHIFFTDREGREHKLTTEVNMPGENNPVTIFVDGSDCSVIDEDGLGIKILPNFTCDELGVSH